jgi:uncharacterized protein YggE
MRMLVTAAFLVGSSILLTGPATADSPVSLPQLAAGEVLLEVNAVGIVTSPASSAAITVSLHADGSSEAEARRALAEMVGRVSAAARSAGVAAVDIRVTPTGAGESGDMGVDMTMNTFDVGEATEPSFYANSRIDIRLRDASRAQDLQQRLQTLDGVTANGPTFELDDDSVARRGARAAAIANARADAESYAAATNMRVGRILRVTERTGLDFMGMALSESNTIMRTVRRLEQGPRDGQVDTFVVVGVDFVLAPR